jgi:hypothetical protein
MNSGQMLVTLGALVLLTSLLLSMNRGFATSGSVLLKSKCGIAAISICTSYIEEASNMHFDAITVDSAVTTLGSLNAPNTMGPKSGEAYPNVNDFDDYHGLTLKIFELLPDTFRVHFEVCYVDPANPDVVSSVRTWHKKMTVSVTSPAMGTDTIKMNYIFSYWYFR